MIILKTPLILQFQLHRKCKNGTFAIFTLHLDISSHHLNDLMADRHPEASALYPLDLIIARTLERLENLIQKLRFHTSSVLLKHELIISDAVMRVLLVDFYRDSPILRRILNCVREDIHQYLFDTLRIAFYILMPKVLDVYI